MHHTKCFNCSREMVNGAFSYPAADSASLVHEHHTSQAIRTSHNATYGLLATTKKWDHFPKNMKGRISPCPQGEGGGRRQWASAWQTSLRQAALAPATGRHSKFISQLRVNAYSLKYITLCMIQFLCWGLRGEQSYSNQDQFTLNGIFTGEKGL